MNIMVSDNRFEVRPGSVPTQDILRRTAEDEIVTDFQPVLAGIVPFLGPRYCPDGNLRTWAIADEVIVGEQPFPPLSEIFSMFGHISSAANSLALLYQDEPNPPVPSLRSILKTNLDYPTGAYFCAGVDEITGESLAGIKNTIRDKMLSLWQLIADVAPASKFYGGLNENDLEEFVYEPPIMAVLGTERAWSSDEVEVFDVGTKAAVVFGYEIGVTADMSFCQNAVQVKTPGPEDRKGLCAYIFPSGYTETITLNLETAQSFAFVYRPREYLINGLTGVN